MTATTDLPTFSCAVPESDGLLSFLRDIVVNRRFAPQTGQTVVRVGEHPGSDFVSISRSHLQPLLDPIPPENPVSDRYRAQQTSRS